MARAIIIYFVLNLFLLLFNAHSSLSQHHPQLQEQTLIDIKQSMLKQSLNPTIVSALEYLTVFSFSPKLVLSSPLDLNGKRIVVLHPFSSVASVKNHDETDILVNDLVLTETAFKSQLEMYTKNGNQSIIVPHSVDYYFYVYSDCVFGDPLEMFDVFVMSSQDFLQSFLYQVQAEQKEGSKRKYKWSDFSFLREFQVPISLSVYYNETKLDESIVENQVDSLYNRMNEHYFINDSSTVDFEINRNIGYMFHQNGFGNISNVGKEFLSYYLSQYDDIPLSKKPIPQFYPFSNEKYIMDYQQQSQLHYNQSTSAMLFDEMFCNLGFTESPIICSHVVSEVLFNSFVWLTVIICFLFYLALITVFKTKSIKRRLTAPYMLPILLVGFNTSLVYTISCRSVNYILSVCFLAAIIGVYAFCLIRFTYLRYLYLFLSKSKSEKTIKIHKFLVSTWFGIIGSLFSGIIHSIFWMVISIPYVVQRKYLTALQADLNIIYGVQILSGAIFGSFIIIIDIAIHWKKIKDKGIYNFLTFEDPFGLRIDLIYFMGIIVATIIIAICGTLTFDYQDAVSSAFTFIASCLTYGLAGGTAIIMEWRRFISKKRNSVSDQIEESRLEELMKDDTFRVLFKRYCAKEVSLENALLYEELDKLKEKDDLLPFETFKHLYETYFQSLSKYEINLPSAAKKELVLIYQNQQPIKLSRVLYIVITDLMLNLNDTFERLKQTSEFKKYSFTRDIQLKNSIV